MNEEFFNLKNISIENLNENYIIDFYQRDYKWTKKEIDTLLNDLFGKFDLDYQTNKNKSVEDLDSEQASCYRWYYLSTFIVSKSEDKKVQYYLVDGQQRITSISLLLIALYHFIEHQGLKNIISGILKGNGITEKFILENKDRKNFLSYILGLTEESFDTFDIIDNYNKDSSYSVTVKNLKENLKTIISQIRVFFKKENNLKLDQDKLNHFLFFFIKRVILIKIDITKQTDIPMVFEVINNRGIPLKQHEILKGHILSKILDKSCVNKYAKIWEDNINKLEEFDVFGVGVDIFFIDFIFLKLKNRSLKINGKDLEESNYSKFYEKHELEILNYNKQKPQDDEGIKNFLENDFQYYVGLYYRIYKKIDSGDEWVSWLELGTENNNIVILCMAVCEVYDKDEDKKLKIIFKLMDRLYFILNLFNVWNSNSLNSITHKLLTDLKEDNIGDYIEIFENCIYKEVEKLNPGIQKNDYLNRISILNKTKSSYSDKKNKFIKYFFAKIDLYLYNIKNNTKLHIYNSEYTDILLIYNSKRSGYCFTIEHILAHRPEYEEKIENFWEIRERFGAICVLPSRENSSINNNPYEIKIKNKAYKNYLYPSYLLKGFVYEDIELKPYLDVDSFVKGINERELTLTKIIHRILKFEFDIIKSL